jgi:hypothetical protein
VRDRGLAAPDGAHAPPQIVAVAGADGDLAEVGATLRQAAAAGHPVGVDTEFSHFPAYRPRVCGGAGLCFVSRGPASHACAAQLEVLQLSTPDAVCLVDCAALAAGELQDFLAETLSVRAVFLCGAAFSVRLHGPLTRYSLPGRRVA